MRFIAANEEATRMCVPVLDRARTSLRSKHPEVVAARGSVEEARLNFEREPTQQRRGELREAKQLLFSTYDNIKGEELMEKPATESSPFGSPIRVIGGHLAESQGDSLKGAGGLTAWHAREQGRGKCSCPRESLEAHGGPRDRVSFV
ncbi:unnamed protein product [Boreogadus saida]